ncbi:MAG: VOC family protein [Bacteroidales bacterium]
MATVSTYLNFKRETEKAFTFYKKVFGTEFDGPVNRFRDIPPVDGAPTMPQEDLDLVMHVSLPILGGHKLMGTDAPESMSFRVSFGNNVYIMLEPDTRKETKDLFDKLSDGGVVEQELQEMFWGDYYGSCRDKFGVQWMFNCVSKH